MKKQLTSFDLYVLVDELDSMLKNARVNKVYQIADRELKIKLHSAEGSKDLIIAPNYLCISQYSRSAPQQPTSFAMQLRKHIGGGFIREVSMHEFDRIIEFKIEKENKYVLVAELFSKGNVIFCNGERKIIGILESQKWKDRELWVGKEYKYPPKSANPLDLDKEKFIKILKSSEKSIVRTLASDVGLGGFYAEDVCLKAKLDKNCKACKLEDPEIKLLYDIFYDLIVYFKKIRKNGKNKFEIIYQDKEAIDVLPGESETYSSKLLEKGLSKKEFQSFNDAVDEYFSKGVVKEKLSYAEDKYKQELKRLTTIAEKQKETIEKLNSKAVKCHEIGNLIYQNMATVERVITQAKKMRKTVGDDEVIEQLKGLGVVNLKVNELELELKK